VQFQACKARVRVVTASDDDGYDSDNNDTTTHWSQQLITVNHAAQLDTHDTQVIEVSILLSACYSQTTLIVKLSLNTFAYHRASYTDRDTHDQSLVVLVCTGACQGGDNI
jgi:hypothetical protein